MLIQNKKLQCKQQKYGKNWHACQSRGLQLAGNDGNLLHDGGARCKHPVNLPDDTHVFNADDVLAVERK